MFDMRLKKYFLDSSYVKSRISNAARLILIRQGAFIRKKARSLIRKAPQMRLSAMSKKDRQRHYIAIWRAKKRGKPKPRRPSRSSLPGKPPYSQVGTLRRSILFLYDPGSETVVVGPEKTPSKAKTKEPICHILEYGGPSANARGARFHIKKRPYMGPAAKKGLEEYERKWKDSVRG